MTETVLAGRFLFGVGVGIGNVCLSKVLNDCIPNEYSQYYGLFQNSGYGVGIFISNLIGILVPLVDGTEQTRL